MDLITPEMISAAASIAIWISTAPQAYQTLRTRLTRDLSLINLIACVIGLALWTTFAIMINQVIFAVGDGVDMAMWSSVLVVKVHNVVKRNEKAIVFKDGNFCVKYGHYFFGKFDRCLICNVEKRAIPTD